MKKFTIYFELFGKKMKNDIDAYDENDAKRKLEAKIIYHKITSKSTPLSQEFKNILNYFNNILNTLK